MKWLIVYEYGKQEIVEADDFHELHGKVDADDVVVAVKLDSNIEAKSY